MRVEVWQYLWKPFLNVHRANVSSSKVKHHYPCIKTMEVYGMSLLTQWQLCACALLVNSWSAVWILTVYLLARVCANALFLISSPSFFTFFSGVPEPCPRRDKVWATSCLFCPRWKRMLTRSQQVPLARATLWRESRHDTGKNILK